MDDSKKPLCKYGEKCYQKNTKHLLKYKHPSKNEKNNEENAIFVVPSDQLSSQLPTSPFSNANNEKRPRIVDKPISSPETSSQSDSIHFDTHKFSSKMSQNVSTSNASKKPRLAQNQDIDFISDLYDNETKYSQRLEYKEMLNDPKVFIKNKFLFDMPDDFYQLWEFCKKNVKNDEKPENMFSKFGLSLIGPFHVLTGDFKDAPMFEPGDYLRHCRYYFDPPEFQTILKKNDTGIHYGYWRDNPDAVNNCFIAKNDVNKGCEITFVANNIFSAIIYFLNTDACLTIFTRPAGLVLKQTLEKYATECNIDLSCYEKKLKLRNSTVVSKTFHKAGLVVPIDRKTNVGYRELIENDDNLKEILKSLDVSNGDQTIIRCVMDKLQPLITAANIAVDECDFGNSIELGINLFCSGHKEVHVILLQMLVNGYSMISRPQFIAISKAHLEQRDRGTNLSIV